MDVLEVSLEVTLVQDSEDLSEHESVVAIPEMNTLAPWAKGEKQ